MSDVSQETLLLNTSQLGFSFTTEKTDPEVWLQGPPPCWHFIWRWRPWMEEQVPVLSAAWDIRSVQMCKFQNCEDHPKSALNRRRNGAISTPSHGKVPGLYVKLAQRLNASVLSLKNRVSHHRVMQGVLEPGVSTKKKPIVAW